MQVIPRGSQKSVPGRPPRQNRALRAWQIHASPPPAPPKQSAAETPVRTQALPQRRSMAAQASCAGSQNLAVVLLL